MGTAFTPETDGRARRYALGVLEGADLERFEDQMFSDEALLELVNALEAELSDEYVRGELTGVERAAFDARLQSSQALREKVAFARTLLHAPVSSDVHAPAGTQRAWAPGTRPVMWLAAAAIVILAVGVWRWRTPDAPPGLPAIARQTPSPVPSPVETSTPLPPSPSPVPSPGTPNVVATLSLFGARVRETATVPVIRVPAAAQGVVAINVAVDDADVFPQYRIVVTDRRGREVWVGERLRAVRRQDVRVVDARVPADALTPGSYRLELRGTTGTTAKVLSVFDFDVSR